MNDLLIIVDLTNILNPKIIYKLKLFADLEAYDIGLVDNFNYGIILLYNSLRVINFKIK
jgi:hypothetical protein